jgi:hypothetical protein
MVFDNDESMHSSGVARRHRERGDTPHRLGSFSPICFLDGRSLRLAEGDRVSMVADCMRLRHCIRDYDLRWHGSSQSNGRDRSTSKRRRWTS